MPIRSTPPSGSLWLSASLSNTKALVNPRNDALGTAAALQVTGFEVVSGLDLSKADRERSIRGFLAGCGRRLWPCCFMLVTATSVESQLSHACRRQTQRRGGSRFRVYSCFRGARSDGARSKKDPDFSRRLPRRSTCA